MIISTIATALIQCRARTQAGWITFVVVAVARSSLTVRVDMALPVGSSYQFIRREPGSRYCHVAIQSMHGEHFGHKKASRVAPARRLTHPVGTMQGRAGVRTPASARYRPHESRRSTD